MTPPLQAIRAGARVVLAFVAVCGTLALGQPPAIGPDAPYAAVRVLRTGASDGPLDVWLGQTRLAAGVAPGRPSEYAIVPAGRHEVGLTVAGDDASAGPSSTVGQVAVAPATYVTLVVPGVEATDPEDPAESDTARALPFVVEDPLIQLPPVGDAALRVVHVAAKLPPLLAMAVPHGEVAMDAEPPDREASSESTRYTARVNAKHGSAYGTVEAGTYGVWLIGEDGEAVLPEPLEVSLRSGALHTVFVAAGSSQTAQLTVAVDATGVAWDPRHEGGSASLRLLHASPDAPLVDLLVDGTLTLRDVARGAATSYVSAPAGRHLVEVYPHRLRASTQVRGTSSGSEKAQPEGGDNATEPVPATAGPEGPASVRRLDPVTALVDVPEGKYTTLVLAGHYEPAGGTAARGGLSLAVEPGDAGITVQGPEGDVVASEPGPKLLEGLAPGRYQIEVRQEGFQSARYEVEVQPGTTSDVSVTLQQTPDPSESESGETDGEEDSQGAAPAFANAKASQGERRSLELQTYPSDVPIATPGSARVRFVHAAPSVSDLEIVASRAPAGGDDGDRSEEVVASIERIAYPNVSEYLAIDAGEIALTFRLAGSRNQLRRLEPVGLTPGVSYTLYLVARAQSLRFGIVPSVDAIAPQRALGEAGR